MFYTIYKITNTINGKIYIGCHKTYDIDDDYMGSGKHLNRAKEKYGIENFEKVILHVFDNPEQMFEMESLLVNSEFVKRSDNYNLKEGGFGGFDFINSNPEAIRKRSITLDLKSEKQLDRLRRGRETQKRLMTESPDYRARIKKNVSLGVKNFFESGGIGSFTGKSHTSETKSKMQETHKLNKHQQGEKNSQFGTMWIHNLDEKISKRIKIDEFSQFEAEGWLKGRKMKF